MKKHQVKEKKKSESQKKAAPAQAAASSGKKADSKGPIPSDKIRRRLFPEGCSRCRWVAGCCRSCWAGRGYRVSWSYIYNASIDLRGYEKKGFVRSSIFFARRPTGPPEAKGCLGILFLFPFVCIMAAH